jgi:hypothetical protein
MKKIALPWGVANGMWFAKTRIGRYRNRPGGGRLRLGAQPERSSMECAARCLRHGRGGQGAQEHHDALGR